MSDPTKTTASDVDALAELEGLLKYRFRNRSLLLRALTHRSFVHEHEDRSVQHNESLEFLGDAVLGFLISASIFDRFPDFNEGQLSKIKAYLVSSVNLVQLADKIRLGGYLLLSKGEDKTGGRKKRAILVDAYEAILGAIYLDGGINAAAGFIAEQIRPLLDSLSLRQLAYGDFKSALQEHLHNTGKTEPAYQVVDEIGPDHRKVFVVEVLIDGEIVARSSGRTKKEAQQEAARAALSRLTGPAPEIARPGNQQNPS
jgi:ribonuclease-3